MPLAAMAIPAIVGGVGSIASGIIGSNAASTAAQQQTQAAQQGMSVANQNLGQGIGTQNAIAQSIQGSYAPYQTAGAQGVGQLSNMMTAAPGGLLQPYGQTFQAPTAEQAQATPGYQFTLQQGLNALQSSAAAKGNLLTGGTMKGMANYASGLASGTYQQTYNNALNSYQQNYGQFLNQQQNNYNRLMGLTGIGAGMVGQLGQLQQAGAQNAANLYNANTGAMSNLLGAKGTAQAYGTMGQANAWGNTFGGLTGAAALYGMGKLAPQPAPQPGGGGGFVPNLAGLSPDQVSGLYGGPSSVGTMSQALPETVG